MRDGCKHTQYDYVSIFCGYVTIRIADKAGRGGVQQLMLHKDFSAGCTTSISKFKDGPWVCLLCTGLELMNLCDSEPDTPLHVDNEWSC